MPPPTRRRPPTTRRPARRLARLAVAALALAALAACQYWRPAVVPMRQAMFEAPCPAAPGAARPLLVLLPGRFMGRDEMVDEGFVDAVRRRGIDADVQVVDAHLGYYADRTFLVRLEQDVLAPARARGVTQVWLVGISLGGFGAALYAEGHPDAVAGLVALSPYLGEDVAAAEIRAAGGLRTWRATGPVSGPVPGAADDAVVRGLWTWLQRQSTATPAPVRVAAGPAGPVQHVALVDPAARGAAGAAPPAADLVEPLPPRVPPLWLGYGDADRFPLAHRVLAEALPADRVVVRPGGHDFGTWRPLWNDLLDRLPLPRRDACAASPASR